MTGESEKPFEPVRSDTAMVSKPLLANCVRLIRVLLVIASVGCSHPEIDDQMWRTGEVSLRDVNCEDLREQQRAVRADIDERRAGGPVDVIAEMSSDLFAVVRAPSNFDKPAATTQLLQSHLKHVNQELQRRCG